MTDIMAPLPPATTPTPSPRAEPVSRPEAPFGPALAEARGDDARRSGNGGRASESSDADGESSTAADDEAPETERAPSMNEERSTPESDSSADRRQVAGDESPRPALPHAPETAESATAEPTTTATSDLLIGRPPDHPTAKGAVGDGGLSTDPTVERAASPDIGSMAMSTSTSSKETPAQQATSTAHGVVDAPAALAVPGQSAGSASSTTAEVTATATAGTTTATGGAPTAQDFQQSVASSMAAEPTHVATAAAEEGDGSSATQAAGATNTERPSASVETLDGSDSGGEGPAVVTTERVGSTRATQTTDAASAAGADATRPVDGAKLTQAASASPSAAPPAGPLDPAVGSLWDDVRTGLERMRTSAEGQEVRIRLRPAELGELIVQVRTNGDQVAVRLLTTSAAAQQALVDDRLRLAAELARAGFDRGSVDIGQQESTPFGQSPQDTGDERGRGRTVSEPAPAATERGLIEQRDPILTLSGRRPGRHAYSTINLTL